MSLVLPPEVIKAAARALQAHKVYLANQATRYEWPGPTTRPKQLAPGEPGAFSSRLDWRIWLLLAGRGFGKALDVNTPIPTPTGWSTMGKLQVGDQVFDEQGNPCTVTFCTEYQHGRACYIVRFSDGSEIVADGDHRWITWDKRARKAHGRANHPRCKPQMRTTNEIAATLMVGREVNHSVQVAHALNLPDAQLTIDPYVLGVWLGDGTSTAGEITTADEQVLDEVRSRGYATGKLHSRLKAAGLIRNKHIPAEYLRASERQRRDLLAGLMDTDGSISLRGHAEFTTTSTRLRDGVFELVVSLGFKATCSEGVATINGREVGPKYRITFTPHKPVCILSRKLQRQHEGKGQADRVRRRYVISVEQVASRPVKCITVDSPSHLYLAGRSMIPTHNTLTGAEYVNTSVRKHGAMRVALVGATMADVRDTMIEGPTGILQLSPPWFMPIYEPGKRRVTWPNGAQALCFSAEAPERARGPQFHIAWADELGAWQYAQDTWDNLEMMVRLGLRPRIVVTTTPRPTPLVRQLNADPDCEVYRATTWENKDHLPESFLKRMRDKYGNTRLGRQELEAEILDENPDALFSQKLIDQMRLDPSKVDPEYLRKAMGMDPAVTANPDSDETGMICGGAAMCSCEWALRNNNGKPERHAFVFDDLSGLFKPLEWATIACHSYTNDELNAIIAEVNNGGDLVAANIHSVNPHVVVKTIHAKKGKVVRAEPTSSKYEQGKVHHLGWFPKLEDQLTQWNPKTEDSPDRLDADVYLIDDLLPDIPIASYRGQRAAHPRRM